MKPTSRLFVTAPGGGGRAHHSLRNADFIIETTFSKGYVHYSKLIKIDGRTRCSIQSGLFKSSM